MGEGTPTTAAYRAAAGIAQPRSTLGAAARALAQPRPVGPGKLTSDPCPRFASPPRPPRARLPRLAHSAGGGSWCARLGSNLGSRWSDVAHRRTPRSRHAHTGGSGIAMLPCCAGICLLRLQLRGADGLGGLARGVGGGLLRFDRLPARGTVSGWAATCIVKGWGVHSAATGALAQPRVGDAPGVGYERLTAFGAKDCGGFVIGKGHRGLRKHSARPRTLPVRVPQPPSRWLRPQLVRQSSSLLAQMIRTGQPAGRCRSSRIEPAHRRPRGTVVEVVSTFPLTPFDLRRHSQSAAPRRGRRVVPLKVSMGDAHPSPPGRPALQRTHHLDEGHDPHRRTIRRSGHAQHQIPLAEAQLRQVAHQAAPDGYWPTSLRTPSLTSRVRDQRGNSKDGGSVVSGREITTIRPHRKRCVSMGQLSTPRSSLSTAGRVLVGSALQFSAFERTRLLASP